MTTDFMPGRGSPAQPSEQGNELLSGRLELVLMDALEASLESSRKALLALDLGGVELGSSEQTGLVRKLGALLSDKRLTASGGSSDDTGDPAYAGALGEELQRSAKRILNAVRLQAALLSRSQRKLRVLANTLAGPGVSYGPLLVQDAASPLNDCRCGQRF